MKRRTKDDDSEIDETSQAHVKRARASHSGHLPELLDLTSLDLKDSSDLLARFDRVARALLHDYLLVIANSDYHILELEFYLWATEHEDPFTHGSEEQKLGGHWYFHRAPRRSDNPNRNATSLTGYRGGTRKGLDLTIGIPRKVKSQYFSPSTSQSSTTNPDMRGGILLRTIRRCSDDKVISGPSLLVDEILRVNSVQRIAELVDEVWEGDRYAFPETCCKCTLYLKPALLDAGRAVDTIYRSPRIGLDLSHPGTTPSPDCPRVIYVAKPYRYFMHPSLLTANGRCQTLLGVYDLSIDKDLPNDDIRDKLSTLTGIKAATVSKYLQEYHAGATRNLKAFVGPSGKGVCSSPSSYLQMMGAVHAAQAALAHV